MAASSMVMMRVALSAASAICVWSRMVKSSGSLPASLCDSRRATRISSWAAARSLEESALTRICGMRTWPLRRAWAVV